MRIRDYLIWAAMNTEEFGGNHSSESIGASYFLMYSFNIPRKIFNIAKFTVLVAMIFLRLSDSAHAVTVGILQISPVKLYLDHFSCHAP